MIIPVHSSGQMSAGPLTSELVVGGSLQGDQEQTQEQAEPRPEFV